MRKTVIINIFLLLSVLSCKKDDYKIDYQDGYPSSMTGNWVVFEFSGGKISGLLHDPYDLVTALDPNNKGYLIFDKLYNSNIRVRAMYDSMGFSVIMGPQLEKVSTNNYGIEYISLDGLVSRDANHISIVYSFAASTFNNIGFTENDIKDVIVIHAGYYDQYKNPIDTVLIMGYRKTGFENVDY